MNKLLFIVLMSASIGAFANSKSYEQCLSKSEGITIEILNCIEAEAEFQDARLNTNYKKAMSLLAGSKKQNLLSSQRLWLKHHGDVCDVAINKDGGSSETITVNECYLQEIIKRADYLEQIYIKSR